MADKGATTDDQENGFRLQLLREILETILRQYFHKHFKVDPKELYLELKKHQNKLDELRKNNIISNEQYGLLLPKKGAKTFSSYFDASLLLTLLFEICDSKPSEIENFIRIRKGRNIIQHSIISISNNEFLRIFNSLEQPLLELGCSSSEIERIKTIQISDKKVKEKIQNLEASFYQFNYNFVPSVPNFIGRESNIIHIHSLLDDINTNFTSTVLGVVICGMAGIGKTELVKKYWMSYSKTYYKREETIIWINSQSKDSIKMEFQKIGDKAGLNVKKQDGSYRPISEIVTKVYRHFAIRKKSNEPARRILFVFDNFKTPKDIESFFPPSNAEPYMLITSQRSNWDSHFKVTKLDLFTKDTAYNFLIENIHETQRDENTTELIITKLERHPLALQQAVSYINTNTMNVTDYLLLFNTKWIQLMNDEEAYNNVGCKPVLTTFNIALDDLKANNNINDTSTLLLNMMAYIDGKNIKKGFLLKSCNNDITVLNKALTLLNSYSIINLQPYDNSKGLLEHIITMHSLVQLTVKYGVKNNNEEETILKAIFDLFFEMFNTGVYENKQLIDIDKYWFDHYLYMFEQSDSRNELLNQSCKYQVQLIKIFEAKGNDTSLIKILKSLEEMLLKLYTNTDEIVLNTQHNIAQMLSKIGIYEEALDIFYKVSKYKIQTLDPDSQSVFITQHNIADCLTRMGRFKEALAILYKLESQSNRIFEPTSPDVLAIQLAIATNLSDSGLYQNAVDIYNKVEAVQLKTLESNDHNILLTQHNLAECHSNIGMYQKALEIYRKVEVVKLQKYGPGHPSLLNTLNNITWCRTHIGEIAFNEAVDIYRARETMQLHKSAPEHPDLLLTQSNIAYCLTNINKHEEALDIYNTIANLHISKLKRLQTKLSIGKCLVSLGNISEGKETIITVKNDVLETFGDKHPLMVDIKTTLHQIKKWDKTEHKCKLT